MSQPSRNEAADNLPWSVTLRFGNVLLACVLLALSAGVPLTPQVAHLCHLFALSGMAFYFCLELAAERRAGKRLRANASSAERRRACRLRAENHAAKFNAHVLPVEDANGNIECAMDRKADFSAFLGAQTQPTLSV